MVLDSACSETFIHPTWVPSKISAIETSHLHLYLKQLQKMSAKKSIDTRFQLHVWNKLLEGRIALQKVVIASRELQKPLEDGSNADSDQPIQTADETTIKSVSKLLSCLVRLRDSYRSRSQFKANTDSNEVISEDIYQNITDELLEERHDSLEKLRDSTIEKWCEKTKISMMPKKGYTALELPTIQLIKNAMKDKQRLIRRTQIDRTNQADDNINPETFNDDDFYHILLKEVISKDEGRRWAELQRTKYKSKRKTETKATKGRKIRKDLIPKLVNFMAPITPANELDNHNVPERIREELMRSLFGGSIRSSTH